QSHPSVSFFEVPVPLRLIGTQGEMLDIVLNNTVNDQTFQPAVGFTVQSVQFDPEKDIISRSNIVTLATDDFALEQQLVLYPNPTSGIINFQKPEALRVNRIKIYNALGQSLYNEDYYETVDVSKFAKGILFFQIETENGIINKTIVRE
ncbi:MAG TPA: T9SS type A sorting domain-containing protein, partial [Aequorivita sp.]|nr:T9SS type A sorting domain-containing protein [Aequorivita sp.]